MCRIFRPSADDKTPKPLVPGAPIWPGGGAWRARGSQFPAKPGNIWLVGGLDGDHPRSRASGRCGQGSLAHSGVAYWACSRSCRLRYRISSGQNPGSGRGIKKTPHTSGRHFPWGRSFLPSWGPLWRLGVLPWRRGQMCSDVVQMWSRCGQK